MNSLDGSWAVRAEGTGGRIACANQLYAGMHSLVELREIHLSSETDLMAMLQKAIHTILGGFRTRYGSMRTRWARRSSRRT